MDKVSRPLDFSRVAVARQPQAAAAHRETATGIPRYFLYGEPERSADERFVHVELLADRSRHNDWRIRPHTHCDLHHLLLVLTGVGHGRADDLGFPLAPPMLLLAPAGVVHAFQFQPGTHGYVVTLSDTFLRILTAREPAFATLFASARCLPLQDSDVREYELEAVMDRLMKDLGAGTPARMTTTEARLQLLLACVTRLLVASATLAVAPAPGTRYRGAALVDAFRNLAESHFRENWQLEDYAQALHVSSAHLRALCVKVAGVSPVHLIHDCAIRAAKRDLIYTNRTVQAIAHALGFEDPAYFSRFFHKRCGLSPGEFRLRMRHTKAEE